ncbi:uncharacterized protein [Typha angustifolia]|uniref:uncharacterized protein n=1 Tax=Typha angustifolia TaxID=59011 RepID=UPI003C2F772F
MPTMTAIALEQLLLPDAVGRCPSKKSGYCNGVTKNGDEEREGRAEDGDDGEVEHDDGGFLDPRVTRSPGFGNQALLFNQSEFYDAAEDFLSDGSVSQASPSVSRNLETELRHIRFTLHEEIARRKRSENTLLLMQKQWQRMAGSLSRMGLSLPVNQHSENIQLEVDPAEFCQEIVVSRLVSAAIERDLARNETEAIAEEFIDSKNYEISRLQDRVRYYEAVNREMSQRNQEVTELARQRLVKRRTRQRWIWSSVGLSVTIGASLLAYSYIPNSLKESLPPSSTGDPYGTLESGPFA